ncbi:lipoprotein [Sphingomicrobium nitratireducens]|uniref:lipoprotein n=1 Tax=Sphingomicrobium nitratireducens TaxID=2964666 RepID=UPI00223ECEAA|nr:lipoprotein [Sphingomicrobium nitratireducens]
MRKSLLAAVAVTMLAACQQKDEAPPSDTQVDYAALEQSGALIEGFQDVGGIQRAVTAHLATLDKRNDAFAEGSAAIRDADAARAFRELAELVDYAGLNIDAIEFVPGLVTPGGIGPNGLVPNLLDPGNWPGNDFVSAFPSFGGIASGDGVTQPADLWIIDGDIVGTAVVTKFENGWTWEAESWDQTVYGSYSVHYRPDGNIESTGRIERDGVITSRRTVFYDNGNGTVTTKNMDKDGHVEVRRETREEHDRRIEKESQELRERREAERERQREEADADTDTDTDTDSGDVPPPNPYLEGYQPSDANGGGKFCPLSLDICRRQMQKALESRKKVQVGVILINPGDPDGISEAPRLKFDTGGLVVNPDPEAASGSPTADPRRFRMRLPVWVLPPRPTLGGAENNVERAGKGGGQ